MKVNVASVAILGLILTTMGCGGSPNASTTQTNPVPACTPSTKPSYAYVLTAGKTVASYSVNSCTGELTATNPATVDTGANDFGSERIAVDPAGRFAYVANLMSNASDLATIAMFTIDPSTKVLSPTTPPTVPTGYFPQGLGIDPLGRFVYTANSDDNTVSMFTVNQTTGVLTPTSPPSVAAGWSPDGVRVDPSGRFAYAVNQDDDTVSMYTINPATGMLTPMTPATVPTGDSPFDITIDPAGKFAYVPNAYDPRNAVSEYTIDSVTGVLTPTAQGLVMAGNSPTYVAVDPASKFAYVVNRQDNTVSAFSIDQATGDLTSIGVVDAGSAPWRAAVDPTGKFLYVGNENDNSMSIYKINSTGSLTSAGPEVIGAGVFDISIILPK